MSWVWDNSPVKGGELLLLLAIADHADDLGGNAWPSIDRLTTRTRVDRRTVQRILRSLERKGLIVIERGRGPGGTNRYTVTFTSVPTDAELPLPSGIRERHREPTAASVDTRVDSPVDDPAKSVDNGAAKCRPGEMPPAGRMPPRGRHEGATGAAPLPPEPSLTVHEQSARAPASGIRGRSGSPATDTTGSSQDDSDAWQAGVRTEPVLADLGLAFDLVPETRHQLDELIARALRAGCPPDDIRQALVTPASDTADLVVVLRSRLRSLLNQTAGDAERPRGKRGATPPRPPWCGTCDERTRHRENASGAPYRCPRCHPLSR
ncbi:helix-turn-helix protein [Labedaea rhizosphaerae]|uniref:Helix-turn-helix protein n=2 Tax=Labedaea rhizosphaerae TaxID=598644 RepID=A0A4R6SG44_LABRH|nr:helix-turn-helix protein [Labedaea rhizosphaerae]